MVNNEGLNKIVFKHHGCFNEEHETFEIKDNVIALYVVMTRKCNANCPFCTFKGDDLFIDVDRFIELYDQLQSKCTIHTIHFTGGEPTLQLGKIIQICDYVKSVNPLVMTSINTNGCNLLSLRNLTNLDNIALSRHHYLDEKNYEIFGSKAVANIKMIKSFGEVEKIHLSCNLIKGYIDSAFEVKNYLDSAGFLGINDIGLVSLMKVNDFCSNAFVDFQDINLLSLDKIINTRQRFNCVNDTIVCKCANYLYTTPEFKLLSIYHRFAMESSSISDYLVYEDNHIKQGFNGEILV